MEQKKLSVYMLLAILVLYVIYVAVSLYWSYESHKKLMQIYDEALTWDKAVEHK